MSDSTDPGFTALYVAVGTVLSGPPLPSQGQLEDAVRGACQASGLSYNSCFAVLAQLVDEGSDSLANLLAEYNSLADQETARIGR